MVTAGLPGPTTFRTRGMASVPRAAAAIPAGPLTRNTSTSPSSSATTSTAGSTSAPRPALGGTRTTIRGTPATTAGVPICTSTDGNEPFPLGTKSAADSMGLACSPTISPGAISALHDASASTRSLNALLCAIACADRVDHGRPHLVACRRELLLAQPEAARGALHAVEARERLADCHVSARGGRPRRSLGSRP